MTRPSRSLARTGLALALSALATLAAGAPPAAAQAPVAGPPPAVVVTAAE